VGFPCCWLGLARLGPPRFECKTKSQILSTSKSIQIHITSKNNTNSTEIIYLAICDFAFRLNPSRWSGLASWFQISVRNRYMPCQRQSALELLMALGIHYFQNFDQLYCNLKWPKVTLYRQCIFSTVNV
jgi:hypothetical protein